ncbi:MAG TPA: glycoside hydrolase family 3 N-terminal domain-containing protein [Candidatus Obscuribacterales bacterium]
MAGDFGGDRPMSLPDWNSLPLPQQVAQMIVVRASGYCFDHQIQYPALEPPAETLRHWIQTLGVGGVILLGGSAVELAVRSQQLQDWAAVPLLLAADIEEGVGQRFSGATWFPPPMALGAIAGHDLQGAIAAATDFGAITAQEALAIGLNWILAPVVDVNSNPLNPVINVRAFGDQVEIVGRLAAAFVQGAKQQAILTTAKHFPGHGDTTTDSHLDLPILPHSLERLQALEFPPFQQAIAAGVDAVMTAHIQSPSLDANYPATLSPLLLTHWLRRQWGFEGLIVTDALVMGAIARRYGPTEAAIQAIRAGADSLLMPADPVATVQAICQAVDAGDLPLERIHASLDRIWHAKHRLLGHRLPAGDTSHQWETLPPPPLALDAIATPKAIATVQTILEQSSDRQGSFPIDGLKPDELGWNVILVDSLVHCPFLGLTSPAIVIPEQRGYTLRLIDPHSPCQPSAILPLRPTIVQLFVRGNPFRGAAGLTQFAQQWLAVLHQTCPIQALLIYGSPYGVAACQSATSPDLPYLFSYGQMPQSQTLLMGQLFGAVQPNVGRSLPFTD